MGGSTVLGLLLALAPSLVRAQAPATGTWKGVEHFGYQLQGLKKEALLASPFDLLVIDYSRDGSEGQRWTKADIAELKTKGRPRRLLAYLSIGEAEKYRYYWRPAWNDKPPAWLEKENPDWLGNIKVRYWDPAWQALVFGKPDSYLDKIVDAGFDGVYLDLVDAYEYFEERGRPEAKADMKAFVLALARYAREKRGKPGFGVFPQNGEGLLDDPEYLAAVTGIGREDTYYGYGAQGKATPAEVTAGFETALDKAVAAGKLVLSIDYVTDRKAAAKAYKRAGAHGYLEYCGVRALDRLSPQPWSPERAK